MGARVSTQNEGKTRSDAIDRQIEEESRNCRKVTILLLGTDAEKSMIVKQMKLQHGLTDSELSHYRHTIYQNSLDSAQALVRAIRSLGIEYADPSNQIKADHILNYRIQHTPSFVFSPDIAEAIHHLWQDPIMPNVMNRRNEFSLSENTEYFFQEILRIGTSDYHPTDSDILQVQDLSQTFETCFTFGALQVTVIDVGKRHSPKKWMHYFEDVTCIIFCASLSGYDHVLQEDDCQNQLSESVIVFESVVNSHWFLRTTIMLFLTDVDVFQDKLPKVPLERYFPKYTGGADVNEALGYIRSKFIQANRAKLPTYLIHNRATNLTTAQLVFAIANETVLKNARKNFRRTPSCSAVVQVLRLYHMFSPAGSQKSRLLRIF